MSANEAKRQELSARAAAMAELARKELGEMSARQRADGLERVKARLRKPRSTASPALRWAALAALCLGGVGVFVGKSVWEERHPGVLSYQVENGAVGRQGVVEAGPSDGRTLRFSDGTEIALSPGASAELRSVDEHGARLALRGKVRVNVVHWPGARWLFDAGPFLITVKGTAFVVDWREQEERLEVVLTSGVVSVNGPLSEETLTLRAGQRLTIRVPEREAVIREIDTPTPPSLEATAENPTPLNAAPSSSTASAPNPAPSSSAASSGAAPSSAASSANAGLSQAPGASERRSALPGKTAGAARAWTLELAEGNVDLILQQAEQRGLEASLSESTSDDLAALADAARYKLRNDIARRALLAQRRRFPQGKRAQDAAFLLGRLDEAARQLAVALSWYERYLDEAPAGTYASEALGRKMQMIQRLRGDQSAQPTAQEYVRRFPAGPYAAAARALAHPPR